MSPSPAVSVILTSYQAADTVERALASIAPDVAAVGGEIVVVDDGSEDGTADRIRAFAAGSDVPLRLFEEGRLGRAAALNLAVERAEGQYLANLDADDISLPGRVPAQLAAMEAEPSLGVLGGRFIRLEQDRGAAFVQAFPTTDAGIRRALAYTGPFCHSTVMYRRAAVIEAGGFSEVEPVRIDHDLWIRIGALGYTYGNLDEILAIHFKTRNSFFARTRTERELARNMFQRNRAAINKLGLPAHLNGIAVLRLGYRFVPEAIRLRITPGTTALSSEELAAYHAGLL